MNFSGLDYGSIKVNSLYGRYVDLQKINVCLNQDFGQINKSDFGKSVEGRELFSLEIGTGPFKILMWSQMHGNESTTTKAVMDLIKTLDAENRLSEEILNSCTLKIVPMLNPDGASKYTRVNASNIDLNRDAKNLTQPESIFLRSVYDNFRPDFCFNLHDQRSIFSAGTTGNPASLSFLAPAADEERSIGPSRKASMQLIAAIQQSLPKEVNSFVGRYDDAFNSNCVGDTFQMLGTPTVLFEAGHFPADYEREETRKYIWWSLMSAILCLAREELDKYSVEQYFAIPNNEKLFYDILIRHADQLGTKYSEGDSIGILYEEALKDKEIVFNAMVDQVGKLNNYSGHLEFDCQQEKDIIELKNTPSLKSLIF